MIFKKSFVIAAVAGAIVAGGLAACGSSGDSSTTSTAAALSSDELVSQANAICKEHNGAITDAINELFKAGQPSAADVRVIVKETILPQLAAWIGQLDQLVPPDDQATAWDQFIADSTAAHDAIQSDPNAAFDASTKEFQTVNAEAQDLGLSTDCLVGPTNPA
jgi:hypothetical protein